MTPGPPPGGLGREDALKLGRILVEDYEKTAPAEGA